MMISNFLYWLKHQLWYLTCTLVKCPSGVCMLYANWTMSQPFEANANLKQTGHLYRIFHMWSVLNDFYQMHDTGEMFNTGLIIP